MFKDSLAQADRRWESKPLFREKPRTHGSRRLLLTLLLISLLALGQFILAGNIRPVGLF